jgi:hypothetical protein
MQHASTVFNLSPIPPLSNRKRRYNPPQPMNEMLDYQTRMVNRTPGMQRSRRVGFCVAAAMVAVNVILIVIAASDRSWMAFWMMIIGAPVANVVLAVISLAFTPVVQKATGGEPIMRHVLISLFVPIGSVICDGIIIMCMGLHGG